MIKKEDFQLGMVRARVFIGDVDIPEYWAAAATSRTWLHRLGRSDRYVHLEKNGASSYEWFCTSGVIRYQSLLAVADMDCSKLCATMPGGITTPQWLPAVSYFCEGLGHSATGMSHWGGTLLNGSVTRRAYDCGYDLGYKMIRVIHGEPVDSRV